MKEVLWVVGWILFGSGITWAFAVRYAARQRDLADEWRETAKQAWREAETLQSHLARVRGEQRSAGRREELAAVLADEPGARPVDAFAVTPGADRYPFMPAPDDNRAAYVETVAAEADEA